MEGLNPQAEAFATETRKVRETGRLAWFDGSLGLCYIELPRGKFSAAMEVLASLRPKLDAFFDKVTVNDPRPGGKYRPVDGRTELLVIGGKGHAKRPIQSIRRRNP